VAFHEGRGVNLKFSRGVCAQDASQDRDLCDSSIGPLAEDDGMEVRAISGDSRGISIGYTLGHLQPGDAFWMSKSGRERPFASSRGHILSARPFTSGCAPTGAIHFLNCNIVKNIQSST
jgi:hypothetical protein